MDRRFAAVGLLLAATGTVGFGLRPAPTPGDPEESVPLAVAGWSARRVPVGLADMLGAVQLPTRLHDALGGSEYCFVLADGARTAFEREPDAALIPASTQKLMVAVSALEALGPDRRLETKVVGSGRPSAGTVDRLWLVGGGDPVLNVAEYRAFLEQDPLSRGHPSTSLEVLADRVVEAGVREVTSGVFGDASRHAGAPTVPTWRPTYIRDRDVPYLSALTVNGGWASWEGGRVTAPDPATNAAAELARLLEARGVVVGSTGAATAPAGATAIARIQSPTVGELVEGMVRESDNLIAEILTREVGLAVEGSGTTEAGTAAVLATLRALDVAVEGVAMNDGSGLDRGNQSTCRTLGAVLALRTRDKFAAMDEGLAVAGRTGTLHRRLKGTDLEGRLRAKTGSLRDVAGLVGVLEGRSGGRPPLAFALVANGAFGATGGVPLQESIARILDAYPFPPADADALAPDAAPAEPGP